VKQGSDPRRDFSYKFECSSASSRGAGQASLEGRQSRQTRSNKPAGDNSNRATARPIAEQYLVRFGCTYEEGSRISPFSFLEEFAMIHELRVYQPVPGQMAKMQARFRDGVLPLWEKHGIVPVGFWTTLVGESSNDLTYMLQWDSLADRETRWTAFQNDPAWHKVRDESERDGPIVASIRNQILKPTSFSALK
jgi:NIPSNAP